jgi:hypothetical protein
MTQKSLRRTTAAKKLLAARSGLYSRLTERIIEEEVLVVVGPGVSLAATRGNPVASWPGLLESGVERCVQLFSDIDGGWVEGVRTQIHSGDIDVLFAAAIRITHQLQGEYYRWLSDTVGRLKADDPSVLEALRDLGLPLATSNFDDLLEQVTGLPPVALGEGERVEQVVLGRKPGILHLFGYWNESAAPGKLLGTGHATMHSVLPGRSLLFVGYGDAAGDPLFRSLLKSSGRSSADTRRFQLCLESETSRVAEEGLIPIPYGNRRSHLAPFLRKLRPPLKSAPEPSDPAPSELDPLLLAFLLVLGGWAKPQLLMQIDRPSLTQAMLAMDLRKQEGSNPLLEAQRRLQEEHPDARPNPLWMSWMRATRGGELQQIAAATAP